MRTLLLDYNGVLRDTNTNKPMHGSQEAVQRLSQQYHIKVVSISPERWPLEDFIAKYFPCIDENNIVITINKGTVPGNIVIDDDYYNLDDSTCAVKILFGGDRDSKYTCLDTWQEVLDYLT